MRTRRQVLKEKEDAKSVSPPKQKKRKEKVNHKDDDNDKKIKPNKKVKKQKSPSPEPSPEPKRRGRKPNPVRVKDSPPKKEKSKSKNKKKDKREKSEPSPQPLKQQQKRKKKKSPQKKSPEKKEDEKKSKKANSKQDEQEVVKKVIVKGAAPVDEYFEKQNGKNYHVLTKDNTVYSCTLNQTNVRNNNNKFYLIQVLQSDSNPNSCFFFTRWGRVGVPGQLSAEGPYPMQLAISLYEKKKHQKTKKDYRELDMNYGDDAGEESNKSKDHKNDEDKDKRDSLADYQESKLPKPLKDFINLIFDIGMMNNQMRQIGYNVNKMPLGKLSKDNIMRGYNILKQLYDELQGNKRAAIIERLTNDFYSYIPHDVGFRNMGAFMLDNIKKVKEKLEMLQSLAEIKIATEILGKKQDGNMIENNYKKLNRNISPIARDTLTFKILNDYLQSTHAKTHRNYELQLMDLFSVQSDMEDKRFTQNIHNKMLLWHGSRLTNYVGILSQGLRIAPPEAPVTGYMFGKGVYFADMSSKSANYCFTNPTNNIGILILCEVALGNMNEKFSADYYAANLPDGKHSTKGVGRTAPKQENYTTLDSTIVPMGPGFEDATRNSSLLYNEYIVYKLEQIKIKYIFKTKFVYKNR